MVTEDPIQMPTRKQNKNKAKKPQKQKVPETIPSHHLVLSRRQGYVFPQHLRRTLRYADLVSLTSTLGGTAFYQFRANSLFDPDLSGTGHQCRFYDQLCSSTGPYTTYRVHAVSVRLSIPPTGAIWGLSAGFTDLSTLSYGISGDGAAVSFSEFPGWVSNLISTSYATPQIMTLKATIAQINNVPEQAVKIEDNFAAAYNANPVDTCYFSIIGNTTGSTSTINIGVYIEYDVTFEDPILMAAS
jgi:hypothetical protein